MNNEPKSFDNVNSRVIDDLRQTVTRGSKIEIAAASFSIYAYEVLKEELEQIDELRFIFTSPTFIKAKNESKEKREFYIPKLHRERNLYGSDFEIKLRNELSQKAIARECADWIRRKARFKTNITERMMNGMLNVKNSDNESFTYMPFNEFTTTEIGVGRSNKIPQLITKFPSPLAVAYLQNFENLWSDGKLFEDVTDTIVESIATVYNENSPEYIYFIALYNIFKDFLDDVSEDELPNEKTGFKDSVIWNKLYNFQKDAALAIINKLEKYNGCILADSVGLGKTFTALAVIKYYESRNKNVLVLCPKKLYNNWDTYHNDYVDNPLVKDRLNYKVLFHTDLSRNSGRSNDIDLSRYNWGNNDLLVIDESHNFRNGGNVDEDELEEADHINRYQRLMQNVIRKGVKTKVLMLSATPVNNRFNDLRNQLQLAYEGHTADFNNALETDKDIDNIFRDAQKAYNNWSKLDPEHRTTQRLLDSLDFDFFKMLDAVTIARSRRHIETYYDTKDVGKFPKRLAPVSRRPKLTDIPDAITFKGIAEKLLMLNYSVYAPSRFIHPSMLYKYNLKMGNSGSGISITGQEKGICKLMAVNMLKRLESSVNSFRLTLERVRATIEKQIAIVDDYVENHQAKSISAGEDYGMVAELDAEDSENAACVGNNMSIRLEDMDYASWKREMAEDLAVIDYLLRSISGISPIHDSKLRQLLGDLSHKIAHSINGNNRKILIFTAFSDTAEYLYQHIVEALNTATRGEVNVAMVTGNANKSTVKSIHGDFNKILTLFSPISKNKSTIYPEINDTIDVLIGTDCISEGQNLQDCDYIINYDIHWNPVRIIQRFGRIDRIGSRNEKIQLVNFWPDMELDEYIKLKGRVESRMRALNIVGGGDEDVLSPEQQADLDYRKQQLLKMQHEVVNIEDMNTGISITDLGLNEFRMDLLSYRKQHPNIDSAPFGMSAVTKGSSIVKPGVIFLLRNINNGVNIGQRNLIHPYYMVYLADDGTVVTDHLHPKQILDYMRAACAGRNEPIMPLCSAFNRETRDGCNMKHYSQLLQSAIKSIIDVKEESDIDSLFSDGETSALVGEISGLDDFELITFLVIK